MVLLSLLDPLLPLGVLKTLVCLGPQSIGLFNALFQLGPCESLGGLSSLTSGLGLGRRDCLLIVEVGVEDGLVWRGYASRSVCIRGAMHTASDAPPTAASLERRGSGSGSRRSARFNPPFFCTMTAMGDRKEDAET